MDSLSYNSLYLFLTWLGSKISDAGISVWETDHMELKWKLAVELHKSICNAVSRWLITVRTALPHSVAHTCIPVMWKFFCSTAAYNHLITQIVSNSRGADGLEFEELWSELISNKTASIRVRIIIVCFLSVTYQHTSVQLQQQQAHSHASLGSSQPLPLSHVLHLTHSLWLIH